jgi:hypothetical protein
VLNLFSSTPTVELVIGDWDVQPSGTVTIKHPIRSKEESDNGSDR